MTLRSLPSALMTIGVLVSGGCSNFGSMPAEETGFQEDPGQAIALLRKACDGGDATGCDNLGQMYEKGTGVKQDNTEALKYYGKACDLKLPQSCENYAKLKTGRR